MVLPLIKKSYRMSSVSMLTGANGYANGLVKRYCIGGIYIRSIYTNANGTANGGIFYLKGIPC